MFLHQIFFQIQSRLKAYNILTIQSLLHGREVWTLKQRDIGKLKDRRGEIHETHSSVQFVRAQKKIDWYSINKHGWIMLVEWKTLDAQYNSLNIDLSKANAWATIEETADVWNREAETGHLLA